LIILLIQTPLLFTQTVHGNESIELKVMTFNIRYNTSEDGQNSWPYRKDVAARIIKNEDVDIVGIQEDHVIQVNDLRVRLPDYDCIGPNNGTRGGNFNSIFYKKERFKVIDSGEFWLTETPETPSRASWDAAIPRSAIWGILEEIQTGRRFFFINTHLDAQGQVANQKGAALLLERINTLYNNLPIIITGDFNARPSSSTIKQIYNAPYSFKLLHTKDIAETISGQIGTGHLFGRIPLDERPFFDYIFVSEPARTISHTVLPDKLDDIFLSDHDPVVAHVFLFIK
jgi:endonuclease/exonuclease/phosphatase family metal-dependent hydrolase